MELDGYGVGRICGYACMQICGQAGIIGNGVRTSRIWQWVEGRELAGKIHFQPSVEINKKNGMILRA